MFDALALKIDSTLVNAKGDLIAATADNTVTRLPVGTDGQSLVADSSQATGLRWATPASGGAAYAGEVPNVVSRLALPSSPGQHVYQQDGGKKRRGAWFAQIRNPASSNANWLMLAERTNDFEFSGTVSDFSATDFDWSVTG